MHEILETKRLCLRKPNLGDAQVLANLLNHYDIASMTGTIPHPFFKMGAEFWIYKHLAEWKSGDSFAYAITNGDKFMGTMAIFINADGDRELGYWIGKPYWGKGYITEAARAVLTEAFDCFDTDFIDAGYFEDNPASGRVLEKLGFISRNFKSNMYSVARGCRFPGIELRLMRGALT